MCMRRKRIIGARSFFTVPLGVQKKPPEVFLGRPTVSDTERMVTLELDPAPWHPLREGDLQEKKWPFFNMKMVHHIESKCVMFRQVFW